MHPLDRIRSGLAWALVFRPLRDKLGLGRVRVAISGAAPVAPQVLEFFWAVGVHVRECYGQTEGSAVGTCTPAGPAPVGKVGTPLPGADVRVDTDGEILVRSAGIFLGYLNDESATREAVDSGGWLHSGDVGQIDAQGRLEITGRKKDIVITSGGKSISPSQIENLLMSSPWVREAIIVGDRRRYLSALIRIDADAVADWASQQGIAFTTHADLSRHEEVRTLIEGVVDEVNSQLAQAETVKRFALLTDEMDLQAGAPAATQKARRDAFARAHGELIEELYA
jgi:long-chain acyl-CoA synthetase